MHFTLTSGIALVSCIIFLAIVVIQMFRDTTTPLIWLLLTALFSSPAGWYLAEQNMQRKAEEVAAVAAAEELQRQMLQRTRDEVAKYRAESLGTQHQTVVLKNGKTFGQVSIKSFKDDGVVFATETGLVHASWADLPDEWALKYRDPVTAEEFASRKMGDAAALAAMEKLGRDVQISFVKELGEKESSLPLRGSVVRVLSYVGFVGKSYTGADIFLVGTTREAFAQSPLLKIRIYPLPERAHLYTRDAKGILVPGDVLWAYTGSVGQSLQFIRDSGAKQEDLIKLRFPPMFQ